MTTENFYKELKEDIQMGLEFLNENFDPRYYPKFYIDNNGNICKTKEVKLTEELFKRVELKVEAWNALIRDGELRSLQSERELQGCYNDREKTFLRIMRQCNQKRS